MVTPAAILAAVQRVGGFLILALMAPSLAAPPGKQVEEETSGWDHYGGDEGGDRYSELIQVEPGNVGRLKVAWTYRTGELGAGFASADKMAFEATPILVRDTLYISTPTNIVIALDPLTGRERWRHDPHIPRDIHYSEGASRGVSSWVDAEATPDSACEHRIFIGTLDARLIALDGRNGNACADFGVDGSVDLLQGVHPRVGWAESSKPNDLGAQECWASKTQPNLRGT